MSNYNWNNKVFIFYLLNYLDLLSKKTPAKDMQEVKNGDKIEISLTPKVVREQTPTDEDFVSYFQLIY
jgi:hypothetical protein